MPSGVYPRKTKAPEVKERLEITLPDGVSVGTRNPELELMMRTHNKWLPIAKKLEQLSGTETIILELGDLTDIPGAKAKNKITNIRQGIRKAWKDTGHNPTKLKMGVNGSKLYVWAN